MLKNKSSLMGAIFLFLAALFWGSAFVAQKKASAYPFATNSFRFLLGTIILLPIIIIINKIRVKNGKPISELKAEQKKSVKGGIICGVTLAVASSFQQLGMSLGTTAGKSGFLTALYIVFIPVLSLFLKKKTSWYVWVSVAIAFIGAYLMSFSAPSEFCVGDVLTIICAVAFAVNVICVDIYADGADALTLSLIQCFTAGVTCFIAFLVALIFGFEKFSLETISVIGLPVLYIAVFSCCVAYSCQILGQRHTPPAPASILMSLESVFSVIFGILILKEIPSTLTIIGIVLIFIAIMLSQINLFIKPKKPQEVTEKDKADKA